MLPRRPNETGEERVDGMEGPSREGACHPFLAVTRISGTFQGNHGQDLYARHFICEMRVTELSQGSRGDLSHSTNGRPFIYIQI